MVNAQRGESCTMNRDQKEEMDNLMEDLEYTCGSVFADIKAEYDSVQRLVFANTNLTCNSPNKTP